MWSYQQYPRPNDIVHFGVKGMKWGVRRERMKRAREAYALGRGNTRVERNINKVNLKIDKKMGRGKDISNLELKRKKLKAVQAKIKTLMKTKTKDLTSKELKMGAAQAIVGRMLKSTAIGGLTLATAGAAGMGGLAVAFLNSGITGVSVATLTGVGGLVGMGTGSAIAGTSSLIRSARRR